MCCGKMTMKTVLVADTNIWIDLEIGKILADAFRLPYQFITTDFSIEELKLPKWKTLQDLGLQTHNLEPEYILELDYLCQKHRQLSTIDIAALLLARAMYAVLLTGGRGLNELAKTQGLSVHGVIWIINEMVIHNILTANQAALALQGMLDQGRRLPKDEC